jgi:hypothetical protein
VPLVLKARQIGQRTRLVVTSPGLAAGAAGQHRHARDCNAAVPLGLPIASGRDGLVRRTRCRLSRRAAARRGILRVTCTARRLEWRPERRPGHPWPSADQARGSWPGRGARKRDAGAARTDAHPAGRLHRRQPGFPGPTPCQRPTARSAGPPSRLPRGR